MIILQVRCNIRIYNEPKSANFLFSVYAFSCSTLSARTRYIHDIMVSVGRISFLTPDMASKIDAWYSIDQSEL